MTTDTLNLPPKTDPRWRDLVLGTNQTAPKLLALKFMLTRITLASKKDASQAAIQKSIEELFDFFQKNARIAEADATALFH